MAFTCALHTYFKVSHISAASVSGLKGTKYQDSLKGRQEAVEESESVAFKEEVCITL